MAISVGSVEVDVIPNTRGIYNRLRAGLVPAATRAGDDAGQAAGRAFGPAMQRHVGNVGLTIGQQIGQQIANRITASLRSSITAGIRQGGQAARPAATRQGEETGGAFARAMKARLEAAFRSLPKANVSLDDTGVDADLARLRARMETLSGKRIGVDVDVAAAQAEITDIEARLLRLGAAHPNVSVRADTAAARAQLAAMREEISRLTADPHRIRLETDGTFGTRLRAAVQAAEASLQNINIGVDTTAADAEVASLRAQLTALRDQRIGIDIDAATATAKIADIQSRLERLSASDADVNVRVDSAAAAAQLAQVQVMVSALDGQKVRIDIDTMSASAAMLRLAIAVGSVGALPAIPALIAGLGAVASMGVAAAVGVGAIAAVAVPAFAGIAGVLLAQKQAQDAATNATARGGQAASQAASKALQMAGAQQALASAHRNAARQITQAEQGVRDAVRQAGEASRNAAQQVEQAEKSVAVAVQQAAEQQRQALQQVKAARQGLVDAVQQAADRQQAANDRVVQAERSVADAQDASRRAQLDLTQARRDAAMELEDLSNRLVDAQLSERDAALGVQEAQQRLNAVRASGSKASALEVAQAQLAYDRAVQRLKEQQVATKRTAAEKKAADKAGVEGSDKVKTAQERVAQAQRAARDQTADLARAQREAAKQQQENARNIAAAQGRVAEAQRNVSRVQRQGADAVAAAQEKLAVAQRNVVRVQEDGARSVARAQESLVATQQSAADSITSAQRQIESSSLSAAGGVDQAALAQQKYQEKLAKLTPAARDTFNAFTDLRGAFSRWSKSLQPAVMPIFTRALKGLKNSLPGLTPIVKGAADGIKALQDRASAGFKKPWWKTFKKDLAKNIKPAIVGLGVAFGNVFKGMVGIVDAFLLHTDGINDRMGRITGRFANWGTNLKGSPGFERFLQYASEKGPQVAEALGKIGSAFLEVARALSPLTGPILSVIGTIADGIVYIATNMPWLIQGLYGAYLAWLALNIVMGISPIQWIILGLLALIVAIQYAWTHFEWFRDIVKGVWSAVSGFFITAWTGFLQPTFRAIWGAIQWVGDKAVWLWQNILSPTFRAIGLAAGILMAIILVVLITPLVLAFKGVATVATWLWVHAIKPAFEGIAGVATWLWKNIMKPAFQGIAGVIKWLYNNIIKPVFALIAGSFRTLARIGKWLWKEALAPAFRGIGAAAKSLYDHVIKPVWSGISTTIGAVWRNGIRPVFNAIKGAIKLVGKAFESSATAIKSAWDKIKENTKKPINWVLRYVWNDGIVEVWKKITGWIPGVPKLGKVDYLAAGGKLRGPQPGMYNRPTAIVGEGNPRYPEFVIPTDPKYRGRAQALHQAAGTQLLAKGGVIGSVGSSVADFLRHPIKTVKGLLDSVRNIGGHLKKTTFGKMAVGVPKMALSELLSLAKKGIAKLFSGGTKSVLKALTWARGQAGKPYQWGGVGNPSWDCSGFMGAIQKVIEGRSPNGRIWSTMAFHGSTAPKGWERNMPAPFQIGVTNRGKGHTAGTLAGVNVESRGGDGVVVGPRARGAKDRMFDAVYGFKPSLAVGGGMQGVEAAKHTARQMLGEFGFSQKQWPPLDKLWKHESGWRWDATNSASGAYGIPQSLPASKMASAGSDWLTNPATQIKWGLGYIKGRYHTPSGAWDWWQDHHWYDQGGYLQPGLNLAYNGTGRPEPVFTTQQANALTRLAADPSAGIGDLQVQVYVGDREITDIARAEVRRSNGELYATLTANRRG